MNLSQIYNQERGCLVHFARLATTLLKNEGSAQDNRVLARNFAKYSPIFKKIASLRRSGLDSRQLKTVAYIENVKSEHVNSNCPIHTATPDTTQARLLTFVVSGGRCELGIRSQCSVRPLRHRQSVVGSCFLLARR